MILSLEQQQALFRPHRFYLLVITFLWPFISVGQSEFEEHLIEQLILAEPGDTIELKAGHFAITNQLSLSVDNVMIKGQGMDLTVLDFKNQEIGAEGFMITGNHVTLQGFTIADPKGDGIKAPNVSNLTIRDIKVIWTDGLKQDNGAYGFYPVSSQNILIEDCFVSGASDAGIYVGQSDKIIVRKNIVQQNVAGIEIENSKNADVYQNAISNNTAGILVFNAPDLPVNGAKTRVFNNYITRNNTKNVSYPSNAVADVPQGTGIMILSYKIVEAFDNIISYHQTAAIIISSYLWNGRPILDPNYDPYPESIYLYRNDIYSNGTSPQGGSSLHSKKTVATLKKMIGLPFPDIIFDGSINPKKIGPDGQPLAPVRICLDNHPDQRFVNLDAQNQYQNIIFSKTFHLCQHQHLPQVIIEND